MNLISITFMLFILILLVIYYSINKQYQWLVLLLGSLLFYIWTNPFCIVFLLISIVSTWWLMKTPTRTHWYLTLIINLGLLIVFRYSIYWDVKDLIVPLGISFYTFMTLGYAHSVYEKKIEPCDNLLHYALYISYFPQIVEGPIGVYQNMMPQLLQPHKFEMAHIQSGAYRCLKGLFKKLVIAGRLNYYVDTVYSAPNGEGGLTLLVATFFYTIELYADFSGYMDIACGVSEMLGIKLKENFIRPYFSKTIQEFWRRWHISLNEWFKEHLMMPAVTSGWNRKMSKGLGRIFQKAKKGTLRTVFPLVLVWMVTGLWHGAEPVYISWGIYYSIIMLFSICTTYYMKKVRQKVHWNDELPGIKIFQVIRTYLIVLIGEVLFRAETLADAFYIYKTMFTNTQIHYAGITAAMKPFGNGNQAVASIIIIALLIGGLFFVELRKEMNEQAFTKHRSVYAALMLVVLALFSVTGQSNFMYQQF